MFLCVGAFKSNVQCLTVRYWTFETVINVPVFGQGTFVSLWAGVLLLFGHMTFKVMFNLPVFDRRTFIKDINIFRTGINILANKVSPAVIKIYFHSVRMS